MLGRGAPPLRAEEAADDGSAARDPSTGERRPSPSPSRAAAARDAAILAALLYALGVRPRRGRPSALRKNKRLAVKVHPDKTDAADAPPPSRGWRRPAELLDPAKRAAYGVQRPRSSRALRRRPGRRARHRAPPPPPPGESEESGEHVVEVEAVEVAEPEPEAVAAGTDAEAADTEPEEEAAPKKPRMILYSTTAYQGKRPVLHVYDADQDPDALSSKKVKRCAFVENAPPSLLGVELKGPNAAVCALRAAIDPSKKHLGNNGINKNVALCVNAEGPAQLLKGLIAKGELRTHLCED